MPDFAIHDAHRAGFGRVLLIVRPDMRDAFERGVVARWSSTIPVELAYQSMDRTPTTLVPNVRRTGARVKPWGTGHAVLSAAGAVDGPFGVVNADDFYGAASYDTLASYLRSIPAGAADYAVVGFPLTETLSPAGGVNRALLRASADGWLEHVEEVVGIEADGSGGGRGRGIDGPPRHIAGDSLISMNMWGFTPAIFPQLERHFREFLVEQGNDEKAEFLLQTSLQSLVSGGEARIRVLRGAGPWCGVTFPADREPVRVVLAGLVERGDYARPAR